jgi:isocitrate dehydrogenase
MLYKNITPLAGEKPGDGTGPDIWAASVRVFDAAIEKAYRWKKKISWV